MTMDEQSAAITGATEALRKIERLGRAAEMTLSNGIVFTVKAVPPILLNTVAREAATVPDPPVTWIDEKQREEPNPNDPAYKAEVARIEANAMVLMRNVAIAAGTAVKSVPDGYFLPEDDRWLETTAIAYARKNGLAINWEDAGDRYIAWVTFYACEDWNDIFQLEQLVYELGVLKRQEVNDALESFRRLPLGNADPEPTAIGQHSNGHRANRADRRAGAGN